MTSFIGRTEAIREIRRTIDSARLTTLTGAAGSGKSRLALQVASEGFDDFPYGVWLVELAPLSETGTVPQAVAAVLGVHEDPGRSLLGTLADALRGRRLLLIIDNCEHLIGACADLAAALLRSSAHVHIFATSREALGILGEVTWPVPPMELPDLERLWALDAITAMQNLLESESVRLFVERARSVVSSFALSTDNAEAIANICRRIDGISLAIELAASRVRVLSVDQISRRLDDRFRLLTGGSRTAMPRHQALQAALDWSYELMVEAERGVLRRLAVFAGGFHLEATEAVAAGREAAPEDILEVLTRLVDKSLVLRDERAPIGRLRMLETVRQYGLRKLLDAREATAIRRAHRDWMLTFAERAVALLRGPQGDAWLEALETDDENLRAALRWSLDERDGAAAAVIVHRRGAAPAGRRRSAPARRQIVIRRKNA